MRIVFIGHLSIDINSAGGAEHTLYGGGVLHGSITACRLGADATVYTKCAEGDRHRFSEIAAAGVKVIFLPSETSTSIRNDYPSANPDDRRSRLLSGAAAFTAQDLDAIDADVLHINPLWFGEFPTDLIPVARKKAAVLGADAQGFLRHVLADGRMEYQDFEDKHLYLPFFDVFKVDQKEARILTGHEDNLQAASKLREWGASTIILTHSQGVCVHDATGFYEAPFTRYSIEGRTGRGDTCTAAFIVARARANAAEATRIAAEITSRKMQYAGPYKGSL